jgi:hypothetical protein
MTLVIKIEMPLLEGKTVEDAKERFAKVAEIAELMPDKHYLLETWVAGLANTEITSLKMEVK